MSIGDRGGMIWSRGEIESCHIRKVIYPVAGDRSGGGLCNPPISDVSILPGIVGQVAQLVEHCTEKVRDVEIQSVRAVSERSQRTLNTPFSTN